MDLMNQLSLLKKLDPDSSCHLDPDMYRYMKPRSRGWHPCFGQRGAAQAHLENQGVGVGDLFLFFGYFKETELRDGIIQFVKGAKKEKHVLFSWLQVGRVYKVQTNTKVPKWLEYHPHCNERHRSQPKNTIYVAADKLSFAPNFDGAGTFKKSKLSVLTKDGNHAPLGSRSKNLWR